MTAPGRDDTTALDVACPKCSAEPRVPCTTGGYLPVGDLPGDDRPEGPHRQRLRAALDAPTKVAADAADILSCCPETHTYGPECLLNRGPQHG